MGSSAATATDFQLLTEYSADIICRGGFDRKLRYVSPSSRRILGFEPEELVGTGPDDMVFSEDLPIVEAAIRQTHLSDLDSPPYTVRMRHKTGPPVWMEISARLIKDPGTGEPVEVSLVMRDVSQRKALEDQLKQLTLTDGLTGVGNRRAFDEALDSEWTRTLREGSVMSLILLDLDHFKEFNDHYGHQAGDDCLRAVAATLRTLSRASDVVARYGGEELVLILPSTNTAGAVKFAEQVRQAIAALRIPHGSNPEGGLMVTASVGVATALARTGGSVRMPETLLLAADNALYKAKAEGRNRIATSLLLTPAEQQHA